MAELLDWFGLMAGALVVTLILSAVTAILSVLLATFIAIAAIFPNRVVRFCARSYVDIFRSIPLLVLLIFVYYVLGTWAKDVGLNSFWLAVIALTLNEAAYLSETYRGGLLAISQAQRDAGMSLGLPWHAIMRHIVIPQAVLPATPSTLNAVIGIVKDSSLASLITVGEVTLIANNIVYATFKPLQVYLALGVVYAAVVIPLTVVSHAIERRVPSAHDFLGELSQSGPMTIARKSP